uniref:C2H2-type domain-containing protein n=1 Tax=Rhabditophanes sp. KR3021 TaxID=114890 RepID=A0AC35TQP5_9BILA
MDEDEDCSLKIDETGEDKSFDHTNGQRLDEEATSNIPLESIAPSETTSIGGELVMNGNSTAATTTAQQTRPTSPLPSTSIPPNSSKKKRAQEEDPTKENTMENPKPAKKRRLNQCAAVPSPSTITGLSEVTTDDKGTCVYTFSCQVDETELDVVSGTSCAIPITVVTKYNGVIYFSTKINAETMHGILTKGEPPMQQIQRQKRAHLIDNDGHAYDGCESCGTPFRKLNSNKRSTRQNHSRDKTPASLDGEEVEVKEEVVVKCEEKSCVKSSNGATSTLREFPEKEDEVVRCPHEQCGYRFLDLRDVNDHLRSKHVGKAAVFKENSSTQTMPFLPSNTTSTSTNTDKPEKSMKEPPRPRSNKSGDTLPVNNKVIKTEVASIKNTPPINGNLINNLQHQQQFQQQQNQQMLASMGMPFMFNQPGLNFKGPLPVVPQQLPSTSSAGTPKTSDIHSKHKIHELKAASTAPASPSTSVRSNSTNNNALAPQTSIPNSVGLNSSFDAIRPSSVNGMAMPPTMMPFPFSPGMGMPFPMGPGQMGLPNQGPGGMFNMNMNSMMQAAASAQMNRQMMMVG